MIKEKFINFDILKICKKGEFKFPDAYSKVKKIFISRKEYYIIGSDNIKVIRGLCEGNDILEYNKMLHKPNHFNSNSKYIMRDKSAYMLGFGDYFKILSYNDHYEKVWEINKFLSDYLFKKYNHPKDKDLSWFFKYRYPKLNKDLNIELCLKEKLELTHLFRMSLMFSNSSIVKK